MKKGQYVLLSIVLLFGFVLGGAVVAKNTNVDLRSAITGSKTTDNPKPVIAASAPISGVADLVEKTAPAVVNVETRVKVNNGLDDLYFNDPFFREFFGNRFQQTPQYQTGIGTGFIISKDGYIITNQHVVNGATQITVKLAGNKTSLPARLVGQDYELDLAVLKIDGNSYPTLPLGDSNKMRVGDFVVAIGEPYGLDHTVTTGVVSAKGRPITIQDRNYKNLIQTDAAINPGNSGGPLLNLSGQVIGINTAVNESAQGIGFAIPINTAKDVLQELMNGQKVIRPYIGISMSDVDESVIQQLGLPSGSQGVVILQVSAGSPAAKAGLRSGDLITQIAGKTITGSSQVQNMVEDSQVGDKLSVVVNRQGKSLTLTITLQAKP
ncbi:MAG: PDZ domain-containing protein [Syntrophomonadaceae bacterium]|nr:PDZ domain-containing protein [Syntrophomonadaceae bacterium]